MGTNSYLFFVKNLFKMYAKNLKYRIQTKTVDNSHEGLAPPPTQGLVNSLASPSTATFFPFPHNSSATLSHSYHISSTTKRLN